MTSDLPTNPQLSFGDRLVARIAAGQVRHMLTGLAGMLCAAGAIQQDQQTQFVTIGTSVLMWVAVSAWSAFQKAQASKGNS